MKQGMRKTSAERGGALEHLALLECLGFLRDISRGQNVLPNLMQQKIQIMSLDTLFVKMLSRRVSPSDPSWGYNVGTNMVFCDMFSSWGHRGCRPINWRLRKRFSNFYFYSLLWSF